MVVRCKKQLALVVYCELYVRHFIFSLSQTDEELRELLNTWNVDIEEDNQWRWAKEAEAGKVWKFKTGQVLIRLRNMPTKPQYISHLAHEIFHAAEWLFDDIGIKHDSNYSSEAYAYLIQYLTNQVYSEL